MSAVSIYPVAGLPEIVNGASVFLDETEALVKDPAFLAAIAAHKR